jgi:hypothetical protein
MQLGRSRQATDDRHRSASWSTPVTLHLACDRDRPVLARLAQLDSRRLPPGPHLVAIREGRIDAAISLTTGEVIADPFRRTAELCELLRSHAGPKRAATEELPTHQLQTRPVLVPT